MKPDRSFFPIKKLLGLGGVFFLLCYQSKFINAAGIEKTFEHIKQDPHTLYTFLQQMPKGGDLHTHFDGGADLSTLLSLAKRKNYCLNPHTFELSEMNASCKGVSTQAFLKDPQHLQHIRTAWSMEKLAPEAPLRYDHFFNIFQKVAPIYRDFTISLLAEMIQRAAAQHELYLEIMMLNPRKNQERIPTLSQVSSLKEKKKILLSNPKVQQLIHQQVILAETYLKQVRETLGCDTNPHLSACAVTIKFQYFVLRENPLDEVFTDALIGFNAAEQSSSIVGINMVQPEKGPRAANDFKKQMEILSFFHQAYPNVPISLHAGELTVEMTQNKHLQNHIQESIHLGHAQRIGHGAALFAEKGYEDLAQTMRKQGIAVEINLTSNQDILALTGKQHPLPFYLQHKVPVVLCTDDAGISHTNLTQEFFKATQQYALNYLTIKRMNRNALTYSFLPGKSLWLNPYSFIPVPECQHLLSMSCQKFIEKNQKAQLQWRLEKELATFEAHWTINHVS